MTPQKYEMDMCHGPIGIKILKFVFPLLLTNTLQRCFFLADLIVIGQFASYRSLAAVGSVGSVTVLILDLFIGIAIGTNVLAARAYGAGDRRLFARIVYTTVVAAWWGGVALMLLGMAVSVPILRMLDTPDDIMSRSLCYLLLTSLGIPAQLLCSVGCALLRSVGDTRRPLVILTIAGILNAGLNLLLVAVFHMDVAGVAIATVVSQCVSVWLLGRLMRDPGEICHLRFSGMRFDWSIFRETQKIGLPAGLQGSCFALSNTVIQSAVNSFGSLAIAGSTAASSVEGFIWVALAAFHAATVSFVAQNYGGGHYRRVLSSIRWCSVCCLATGAGLGLLVLLLGPRLLAVFNSDPEVIEWGMIHFRVICLTCFIGGMLDVIASALRGLGYSLLPAVGTLFGTCVFRLWWVWQVFPHWRSLGGLLVSYPISWTLILIVNLSALICICRKLFREAVRARHVPTAHFHAALRLRIRFRSLQP